MNIYTFPKEATLTIYNNINKEQAQVQINTNFKSFLSSLNEKFLLPQKFTLCYCFNIKDRVIYLACPFDYQLFLMKIQNLQAKNYPMLQIVQLEQDQFVSKDMISDAEMWQEKLSNQYSQIHSQNSQIEQLEEQFQHFSISEIHQQDLNEYHKCQICYQKLESNKYFRCLVCYYFQICELCNTNKRENEHPETHLFIQCNNVNDWNKLKQDSYHKMIIQKTKLLNRFKIHKKNIHDQICCDRCEACPIQGLRYQCCECPDYDLCRTCFKIYQHEYAHNFIQLTTNVEYMIFT